MKFDDLDAKMRVFETAHDHCALPELWLVARLDGRGFTALTKERHKFEAPFDAVFRDHMLATIQRLMDCGFRVIYGYTQSDEISLLFHRDADSFGRKMRKWISVLAGEASAAFSLRLGAAACFDCRISQLPNEGLVCDYFRWRQADAARNALNAHCYWKLRHEGVAAAEATQSLLGLSTAAKHELLFARGVNFNDLPAWQKRGMGAYWQEYEKTGHNPKTNQPVAALRKQLSLNLELPLQDGYDELLRRLMRCGEYTLSQP